MSMPECKHNHTEDPNLYLFQLCLLSPGFSGQAGAGGAGNRKYNVHGTGLGIFSGCSGVSLRAIPVCWPLVLNFTSNRSPGLLHAPCLGMSRYVGQHTTTLHGQPGDNFSHPWAASVSSPSPCPETITSTPHSFFFWRLCQVWLRPRGKMTAPGNCVDW